MKKVFRGLGIVAGAFLYLAGMVHVMNWSYMDSFKRTADLYRGCDYKYRGSWHVTRFGQDKDGIHLTAYAGAPGRKTGRYCHWGYQWDFTIHSSNPDFQRFAKVKPGDGIQIGLFSPKTMLHHYLKIGHSLDDLGQYDVIHLEKIERFKGLFDARNPAPGTLPRGVFVYKLQMIFLATILSAC